MKLKYSFVALILLSFHPEISGQFNAELNTFFSRPEIPLIINSSGVTKISFSGSTNYSGPASSKIIVNYEDHFSDAYFNGNLPTLNQLKNSMLNNIEVSAVPSAALIFKYDGDEKEGEKEESGSFFSSSLFYFLGAAALATAFYFVWQDNQSETAARTFGYPPRPETD